MSLFRSVRHLRRLYYVFLGPTFFNSDLFRVISTKTKQEMYGFLRFIWPFLTLSPYEQYTREIKVTIDLNLCVDSVRESIVVEGLTNWNPMEIINIRPLRPCPQWKKKTCLVQFLVSSHLERRRLSVIIMYCRRLLPIGKTVVWKIARDIRLLFTSGKIRSWILLAGVPPLLVVSDEGRIHRGI